MTKNYTSDPAQTILVVDDDPQVLFLLKDALESCQFDVVIASDGNAAIRELKNQPFDLLIIDLVMPGKEGLETISEVHKSYPAMKILVVSGFEHYFKTAMLFGAHETMGKPLNTKLLCDKVIGMLRG